MGTPSRTLRRVDAHPFSLEDGETEGPCSSRSDGHGPLIDVTRRHAVTVRGAQAPERRTFASALQASALCTSAALRHPGFACSHSPTLRAWAPPHGPYDGSMPIPFPWRMGKRDASAVLGHLAAGRRPPRRPVIAGAAPPKMPVEEFKQREVHDAARARLRGLSRPAGPDPKRSRFRGRQAAGLAACSCPQRIGESRWETTADQTAQASFAAIAHNTGQHS